MGLSRIKAHPHCNLNPGWTWVQLVLRVSALNSLLMNPSWTRVEAKSHPDVGWSEFNLGWPKCSFHVSDCIHACACASAVHSKEMKGRQQQTQRYSLAFGVQPMCRTTCSLQSFEDFTQVSSSPRVYSPSIFNDCLVVSDGSSARWLITTAAAAAAMPFPGVTCTWR